MTFGRGIDAIVMSTRLPEGCAHARHRDRLYHKDLADGVGIVGVECEQIVLAVEHRAARRFAALRRIRGRLALALGLGRRVRGGARR